MSNLVYFSSVSENTHRFVQKLGRARHPDPAARPYRGRRALRAGAADLRRGHVNDPTPMTAAMSPSRSSRF